MHPPEIEPKILELPDCSDESIVLITNNGLRHERFAYRMKQCFGERVRAWYRLDSSVSPKFAQPAAASAKRPDRDAVVAYARRAKKFRRNPGKPALAGALLRTIRQTLDWRRHTRLTRQAEQKLIGAELQRLRATVALEATNVHPADVATDDFAGTVRELSPYFFLSFGGPLYKAGLLEAVRGFAINQHAGHSPDYKGTHTTEWALYHRDLAHVSSTVHITTTGADAGPILRRSQPCIFPDDDPATVFVRVAVLGTELMIEVLEGMMQDRRLTVFEQPTTEGMTYLGKNTPPLLLTSVYRDFRNRWLRDELVRRARF